MNEYPIRGFLSSHREIWFVVLIVAVTLALFWPAKGFDYMNMDDYAYVQDNGMVSGGLGWGEVRQAFTTVHEQWWLPLLWISYMVDVELFGAGPSGHHLTNILLHAVNSGLLFWVLFRMTGSRWRSLFVAALFAWHPTRVEAVAWIAARKDVLSGFFFFGGLWAYAWHVERPVPSRMGVVFFLLMLGLMSKAVLVGMPFILFLLDYWPLERAKTWRDWKPLVGEKIPLLVLSAVFMGVNLWTHVSGRAGDGSVTLLDRLGLLAPNVFAYLGKILVPIRLNILYPENDVVLWPHSLAAILVLTGATWMMFRQREKHPYMIVGWLWFLLALAPVLRGVRLGLAQYADRWTYLPLIGLGVSFAWMKSSSGRVQRWVPVVGGLILVACLVKTHQQLPWWRNSLAMFQRAAFLEPDSHLVQSSLGQALLDVGCIEEGAMHLQMALQLQPGNPEYLSNLGMAFRKLGRAEDALAMQDEAIRLKPTAAHFHNNRGSSLVELGRRNEAILAYEEALRWMPTHAEAHFNLGNLLSEMGHVQQALPHYEAAIRGRPGHALNWYNLGITYAQMGRIAEAVSCVEKALVLDPTLPQAPAVLAQMRLLAF